MSVRGWKRGRHSPRPTFGPTDGTPPIQINRDFGLDGMARKHEAAEWLKKGHSPSQIAKQMKVSFSTVKGYLHNQISEGKIRRSDIVFSLDQNTRRMIEDIV